MMADRSQTDVPKFPVREPFFSETVRQELMKQTLRELYDLLEQYAPAWYPERLHKKAESLLQSFEE